MRSASRMATIAPSPAWEWARKLQRALLSLGGALLALYFIAAIHHLLFSRLALWEFAAAQEVPSTTTPAIEEGANFSLWSPKRIQAYKSSLVAKIDRPIAVLSIHRLLLTAPIFDGTDDMTLNRGLGRIAGTARMGGDGNIGIAGHRDGFFRVLKDIVSGDSIEIATPESQDTYVVDRIDIVDPANITVLRPRDLAGITLVTCYPFYYVGDAPNRYVVHASLKQRRLQLPSRTIVASNPDSQKEK